MARGREAGLMRARWAAQRQGCAARSRGCRHVLPRVLRDPAVNTLRRGRLCLRLDCSDPRACQGSQLCQGRGLRALRVGRQCALKR